ncbi:phage tail protein [Enterobacter hormaechei]|uniref:Phage tail protein n=2 Tax=Enterobacter cloacae complex TaxID=354276 RepID=A0AAE4E5W0_9ENTR|nr:phage tail protein [Enterobacter hormaechei]MDR9981735.1 phage tail protein [Enterobacter hormaechei subsp. steigerwaltii]MDS0019593.1 phage tail protein [Enterobacter hormaechei subsp. steigerwaltii]MDS0108690.1 phage tail protein [Enterobacter hormaechei subsp. steigerwaltii]
MSQTAITLAFEQWKASQAVTGEPVLLDEFIFANVPGLNTDKAIDRNEVLPPAAQIVHRQAVSRKGVVNENAVVHSVVLSADVGDFSFNWIGLINKASNTLAMIVHAPLQQKLKTKDGQQGNVLTRSFLMEYNGAQTETGINTPAETWQIDFTARMAGMDERQRLENIDLYGAAAFLGDGWLVAKSGSQFYVTAGAGYVRGLRAQLAANQNITITTKPVKVWLDVAWTGTLTSAWAVSTKITVAASLADYVQNGVQHYVFAVASIDANGNITDLRPKGTLNDQTASDALAKHEQSRNHPDGTLNAKGFVQLSSSVTSDSEALAATPKGVKIANDNAKAANENANTRLPLTGGWLTGGFGIKTTIGSVSFGVGNSDVYIANGASNKFLQLKHTGELKYDDKAVYHEGHKPTADDVGALPVKGTAEAAKKLATARKIAGVAFDGTSDITLKTSNLDDAGTAAAKDVTSSSTDTTAGRVLQVGDFGIGAVAGVSLTDANNINFNGFFRMGAAGIHGPVANQASELIHCQYDQSTGRQIGWRAGRPDEPLRHRTKMNGQWQGWIKLYDSNNPPTADEVDAVSASKGGTFLKEVAFSEGVKIRNGTGIYQGEDSAGFSSNNLMLKSWNGIGFYCTLTGSEGVTVYVDTRGGHVEAKGQIKPGSYENFDNRFYTKTLASSTFQKVNTVSKGSRGWFKDSNTGMIFQWGIENVSGASTRTFSFPVSFPTGCASLVVSNNKERTEGENSMTGYIKSSSQYSLSNTAATDRQICWFAIGY